jgi:diguanylate cyclase (GGDEF)-like protein
MTKATDNPQKRVLIVDDSKFVRTTFSRILSASFAVVEANDGDAAWQTLQSDASIVMVFTDLDMPKLDGFGLLRLIRGAKDERVRKLPVVVISGSQDQGATSRARAAGASDFISKSAEATDVLARIGELLKTVQPNKPQPQPSATQVPHSGAAAQPPAARAQPAAAQQTATQQIATLQAAAQQQAVSTHDDLTGTLTPQSLLSEGRKHFSYAQRHASPLSVMAFRVDSYAQTARDVGKEISDQLLARIAKMITGMLRAEDSFGRFSEATFMVISAGAGAAQILAFARRLHGQLDTAQVRHGKHAIKIRASFGLASTGSTPAGSIEDLMKLALQRLQVAGTRAADPIVGDAPEPARPAAQQPAAAQQTEIQRALDILERADAERLGEANEEIVRRLLPLLSSAFSRMQLRFPMEAVLEALERVHTEEAAA